MRPEIQFFGEKEIRDKLNLDHTLFQDALVMNKEKVKEEEKKQPEKLQKEQAALEDNIRPRDSYEVNVSCCQKVEHGVLSEQHLKQVKKMHEEELRISQQRKSSVIINREEEKKESSGLQSDSYSTQEQSYQHVNGFFNNAEVTHNHHAVSKRFTIIRVDSKNSYQSWIGETIQMIDKLLVLSHPYILPLKGFVLVDPSHEQQLYSGKKDFDNYIQIRKRYQKDLSVLFFAAPQVTNLDYLLDEKSYNKGERTSYLEKQFPLFWRVKAAIRFLVAVHFLYKCQYGHHNLDSKFLFFDKYGLARLCLPLQPLPRFNPKEDMKKCGKILKELLTGVRRGKEERIFHTLVEDFLSYHNSDIFDLLEHAIKDLRLMDATFSEYLIKHKNGALAKEVVNHAGFMRIKTKDKFREDINFQYEKLFNELAKTEFYYKK